MGLDLDDKLVAVVQQLLGLVGEADACGGARDDDGALGQGGALREEADDLLDREDEVPGRGGGLLAKASRAEETERKERNTHVNPLSCTTFPFFNPLNLRSPTRGTSFLETKTGPIGHAPSKPLE